MFRMIFPVALLWSVAGYTHAQTDFSIASMRARALKALSDGDNKAAIENADAIIRVGAKDPRAQRQAADIYLRAGRPKDAVKWFDKYLETDKQDLPELWQRGIALYFVKDFKRGVEQFEVHRTVNPNDVENAAWHYLCLAKAASPEKAKTSVLPAPGDPRPTMKEVLEMLSSGDTDSVKKRIESFEAGTYDRKVAEFYGYFYLGLYADAHGDMAEAKKQMAKAAKDAPRNYMGDVARVYDRFLKGELNE